MKGLAHMAVRACRLTSLSGGNRVNASRDMMGSLVAIARFDHPHDARVLAGRLEAEGIAVTLHDEHAAALGMSPETGGVTLFVSEEAAPRARSIHDSARSDTTSESDAGSV